MAWSHLQSIGTHSGAAASIAAAFTTANLTSGSKLINWAAANNGSTSSVCSVSSANDGNGNNFGTPTPGIAGGSGSGNSSSFNHASSPGPASITVACLVLDTPAGDAGTKPTITTNFANTGSGAGLAMCVQEFSGLQTGNACIDKNGFAYTQSTTSSTNQNFPAYTTTLSNRLLQQVWTDWGDTLNGPTAAPTGYSGLDGPATHNADANDSVAWKNSTGGSETGNWVDTVATIMAILAVTNFLIAGDVSSTFIAPPPMVIGQGSLPDGITGTAGSPTVTQAMRRSSYY